MAGRRERAVAGAVRTESAGRAIWWAGARGRGWRRGGAGGGDGRARRAGRGAPAGAAAVEAMEAGAARFGGEGRGARAGAGAIWRPDRRRLLRLALSPQL